MYPKTMEYILSEFVEQIMNSHKKTWISLALIHNESKSTNECTRFCNELGEIWLQ
jgi:hypothetical protein